MSKKRISLRDIAEVTGLNRATVSRALRDHFSLPQATCERVKDVARSLGYEINPLVSDIMSQARNIRNSYLGTLAYVTAWPDKESWRNSPIDQRCFRSAFAHAEKAAFLLEEFSLKEKHMTSRRMDQILQSRGIKGVLIAPLPASRQRRHISLDWPNFSSITIGYSVWRPALNRVCSHYSSNLARAMHQLRHLGYSRVGLALLKGTDERLDHNLLPSFKIIQERVNRLGFLPPLIFGEDDYPLFKQWFESNTPDVVMSFGGPTLSWLHEMGVKIPEQTGFVELNLLEADGTLAGIDQCAELVSEAAIDILISQLYFNKLGLPSSPRLILIEGKWIDGKSLSRKQPRL